MLLRTGGLTTDCSGRSAARPAADAGRWAATLRYIGEGFMLRSLLGFDWRKSKAHLLLLSKFLHPKTVDDFAESDAWKTVLGEAPKQAIRRFLNEGMLVQADLSAQLDYKYKVNELKDMLKQRGLAVSGRKGDLIQRLVQADPEGMKQTVAGLRILLCSEQGREIAEQYVANEKAKRSKVEQQVLDYLQQRKFKEASITVASYEAEQVFPRGIGIGWKHYNPARDMAMLNIIFSGKPRILASLSDSHLDKLRLVAGMMYLWGTNQCKEWLPPNFETDLAMDNDAAARMFVFYASHQISLADYKRSGVVKQVEISATQDSCNACKRIAGKRYKLNEVPELPYEHCMHQMGCRCTLLPITK